VVLCESHPTTLVATIGAECHGVGTGRKHVGDEKLTTSPLLLTFKDSEV
jgi:hypothetical protein